MPKKVNKAMSNEETALIENIQSLTAELLQSGGQEVQNSEQNTGDPNEDVNKTDEQKEIEKAEKEKKEEEIKKAGDTANDTAETRVEDVAPNEDSLKQVQKSLKTLLGKVNKSQTSQNSNIVLKSMNDITKVVSNLHAKQVQIEKALGHILDGMGFADKIESNFKANVEKNKPVKTLSNDDSINAIAKALSKIKGETSNQPMGVQKSLGSILPSILSNNV